MPNFHPTVASVPAVLYVTAALLYVLAAVRFRELKPGVMAVVAFVWLVVPITFLSGYLGADQASRSVKVSEELIMAHEAWGRALLILNFALLPLCVLADRARYNRVFFRRSFELLLTSLLVLALYTSFLGGELVFKHGAGVALQTHEATENSQGVEAK